MPANANPSPSRLLPFEVGSPCRLAGVRVGLLGLMLLASAASAAIPSAHADTTYSGWDVLTNYVPYAPNATGAIFNSQGTLPTLPSNLTLYSFTLSFHRTQWAYSTPPHAVPTYYKGGGGTSDTGCYPITNTISPSAVDVQITIQLSTPLHYHTGDSPSVQLYGDSGCVNGVGAASNTDGNSPVHFYQYASWTSATPPNTSTRIDTVTPAGGSLIATSTAGTVGFTGYINASALASSTVATVSLYRNAEMQAAVTSPSLLTQVFSFPVTTSGTLSFSTSTASFMGIGQYTMTTKIAKPTYSFFGFNFLETILVSTTTSFTVGTTTSWDNFQNQSVANIQSTLNTFATSTCAFNFTSFNLGSCIYSFFVPGTGAFAQYGTLTLANSFPFAYAYQVAPIVDAVFNSPLAASSTIAVTTPIGSMTFLSQSLLTAVPFAGLVKALLTAVMWFMAAMVVYRKILKTHDTTSHV